MTSLRFKLPMNAALVVAVAVGFASQALKKNPPAINELALSKIMDNPARASR